MTQMLEYVVTKKNLIEDPLAPYFVTIYQNLHHQTFKKKKIFNLPIKSETTPSTDEACELNSGIKAIVSGPSVYIFFLWKKIILALK